MKSTAPLYKIMFGLAGLALLTVLVLLALGHSEETGPFLFFFFVALAIAFRGVEALRGFSFTVIIFASVTAAMYYPSYFQEVNGFDLKKLFVPLLQLIMFGMGTAMSLSDFAGVVKMPKGVLVGVLCQFTIMPFVGFGLAMSLGVAPEVAAGIVPLGDERDGLPGEGQPCPVRYPHGGLYAAGPADDAPVDAATRRRVYRD